MFSNNRQDCQVMEDHWKVREMYFWMIQSAKKEVFGHFLEIGLLDRLDVAYFDRTKCFPTIGNTARSWRIIQKSQKCISEWFKEPKMSFSAIWSVSRFWHLGCSWYCIWQGSSYEDLLMGQAKISNFFTSSHITNYTSKCIRISRRFRIWPLKHHQWYGFWGILISKRHFYS